MTKNSLLLAATLALLSACSGGGGGGGAPAPSSSASSGTGTNTTPTTPTTNTRIIDNEDMTPGLKGIDANNNGIRDDIDRLIALRYSATPAMKKAAEQDARTIQRAMEATTRQQALFAGDEIRRTGACTFKIFPKGTPEAIKFRERMSIEIESLTANTKERFTAYWKANELMGGAVFSQANEPVCD